MPGGCCICDARRVLSDPPKYKHEAQASESFSPNRRSLALTRFRFVRVSGFAFPAGW